MYYIYIIYIVTTMSNHTIKYSTNILYIIVLYKMISIIDTPYVF